MYMCVCPRHISVMEALSEIIMSANCSDGGNKRRLGDKAEPFFFFFFFFLLWLMLAREEEMVRFTGFEYLAMVV